MSQFLCPHCQREFPEEVFGGSSAGTCPHCQKPVEANEAMTMRMPLSEAAAPDDTKRLGNQAPEDAESTYALTDSEVTEMMEDGPAVSGDSGSLILEPDILGKGGGSRGSRGAGTRRRPPADPTPPVGSETDSRDPLIGQVVGGCEIVAPLGRGAMGAVYRARQVSVDRVVALKTIREDFCTDEHFLDRFQQEARTVGRFNTQHVVQIHEIGCDAGVHFIVMEFVGGGNLSDHVQNAPEKRLSADDALRYLRQAAEGLLEAEKLEIVHRDIKPENLLLDQSGNLKIADFGIAKILGATIQMTNSPAILGTPLYMSPEQAQGKEIDRRSDLYSLGATFYHMLTGAPPVKGESVYDLLQRKVEIDFLSPERILQDDSVPEYLSRVIEKMTALYPEYRYDSFQELVDDLDLINAGHAPEATTPKIKRKKKIWKKVAAVFVILLLGGALAFGVAVNQNSDLREWLLATLNISVPNNGNGDKDRRQTDGTGAVVKRDEKNQVLTDARITLNGFRNRLDKQPDFDLAGEAERLKEKVEAELESIREGGYAPAVAVRGEGLLTELKQFIGDAKARPLQFFVNNIERLKSQLRDASRDSSQFKIEAESLLEKIPEYDKIPEYQDEGEVWKAGLNRLAADFDSKQEIENQLEENRAFAPDSATSVPPYKAVLEYWEKIQAVTAPESALTQLHEWLDNLKETRRLAITGLAKNDFSNRAAAIRQGWELFEKRELTVEAFNASVMILRESKVNLAKISDSPEPWETILPDSVLQSLQASIAGRSSMNQTVKLTEQKVDGILTLLRNASSIDEWRTTRERAFVELKGIDAAMASIAKSDGQAPVQGATEKRKKIDALDANWQEYAALHAKVLGRLANRQLKSEPARQDLDTFRSSPMVKIDKLSGKLTGAWTALEGGFDAAIVELDLPGASQHFSNAKEQLEALGAATDYSAACLKRVEKLSSLTSRSMAPVREGRIELPDGKKVKVAGFFIDRCEVTVEEYKEFHTGFERASFASFKDHFPNEPMFVKSKKRPLYLATSSGRNAVVDSWPIEQVTYYQAMAYLKSIDPKKDLFTYEEWWLAGRGCKERGLNEPYPCAESQIVGSFRKRLKSPEAANDGAEVTGFPRNRSVHHLAGNVAEWCKQDDESDKRARLVGGNYLDRQRSRFSGEDPQSLELDFTKRGYGFRGILRPAEYFADLLPK